jgi:glycosyltransferase involved in cell wall biosynthesis
VVKDPVNNPSIYTLEESQPESVQSPGIPTEDPQAALAFCRQLAEFLADGAEFSSNGADSSPSSRALSLEFDPNHKLSKPTLSVVIPVYDEEDSLPVLYERLTTTLEEAEPSYEILFVDDGSRDGSPAVMRSLAENDRRLAVIELARNFGHQVAISAGLDYAQGNAVIIMDADLQDPPEVLPQFIEKWQQGHEVVYAVRQRRKEGWVRRTTYAAFYRLLQRIANIEIPLDAGDFCIMDRRVVDILVNMPERNRFVRGIRSWIGLDQVGLAYERQARYSGRPKFTFTRLLYLALDGLVSFSYIPLRAISILGFGVSLISILLAGFYAIKRIAGGLNPPGFATTIVAILFLAGMQLITMGVIGEYVGRIFEEVKRRPLYVVRRVVRRQP